MKVLVILPRGLDVVKWREEFDNGNVPDETPYGYHHAEKYGCTVDFSAATITPTGLTGFLDRGLRRLLGFDIRHIWLNRHRIFNQTYDVIWTHTEYEHLAILALSKLMCSGRAPLIAQSIWLMDDWAEYSQPRRWFYKWLMSQAEVATFHSPENTAMAKRLKLSSRVELMHFGVSLDSFPLKAPRARVAAGRRVRVLALGNDKHRDWLTFSSAFGGRENFEVRIGSCKFPQNLKSRNFEIGPMSQSEIRLAYEWADCVVVPLKRNVHVSGLTTLLESIAMGVPVVVTDVGGLRDYFSDECVRYVKPLDAITLGKEVQKIVENPEQSFKKAIAAQRRIQEINLTSCGFAERHVHLSQSMLKNITY